MPVMLSLFLIGREIQVRDRFSMITGILYSCCCVRILMDVITVACVEGAEVPWREMFPIIVLINQSINQSIKFL